jgi:hypothetical protein
MRPSIRGTVLNQALVATCFVAACALVACSGCGSGGPGAPKGPQASVSGSLTNDGKPIKLDSSVVFYCPEAAATAAGKVDALGKFSLNAANPAIGVPAGRYQVMVRPPEPPPMPAGNTDAYKNMMMAGGNTDKKPERPSEIPEKFQTLESSTLVLEVKAGPNTFDIDLAKLKD